MKPKGLFVTGTDTGVGKTIATAVIARILTEEGIRTGVMKPVTSGCVESEGRRVSDDAKILRWAVSSPAADADIAPYILKAPLAPSVAAGMEGVEIDLERITASYRNLESAHEVVLVEGAGGLMVPLKGKTLFSDLVLHLDLPLLVVARPNLGTINHTLLTCHCARSMGIRVVGIAVCNYPELPDTAEEYAPRILERLSGVPLIGVFTHVPHEDPKVQVEEIVRRLKGPERELILRWYDTLR